MSMPPCVKHRIIKVSIESGEEIHQGTLHEIAELIRSLQGVRREPVRVMLLAGSGS